MADDYGRYLEVINFMYNKSEFQLDEAITFDDFKDFKQSMDFLISLLKESSSFLDEFKNIQEYLGSLENLEGLEEKIRSFIELSTKVKIEEGFIDFRLNEKLAKKLNDFFCEASIDARINTMICKFDKNLSKMIIDVNKRMDSLEQDLIETIGALKKYMDK